MRAELLTGEREPFSSATSRITEEKENEKKDTLEKIRRELEAEMNLTGKVEVSHEDETKKAAKPKPKINI